MHHRPAATSLAFSVAAAAPPPYPRFNLGCCGAETARLTAQRSSTAPATSNKVGLRHLYRARLTAHDCTRSSSPLATSNKVGLMLSLASILCTAPRTF
ncbi:hypothetical protein PR002_g31554 [Phytophthora rubi]|uniref:Uncharacterized protein n=1 Tax=Phytophthora rubi TaxID=129364 RepID=A0A6A3GF78_9STRA|nr:hypothetical protein PR002_g31554 [Phytophthora rubi]